MADCIGRPVESIELFGCEKGRKKTHAITRHGQSNHIKLLFEVVQDVSSKNVDVLFWVFASPSSTPQYNRHECK